MNFLGIDYGEKNIGIALARVPDYSPLEKGAGGCQLSIAMPLTTVRNDKSAVTEILALVKKYSIAKIVLGLPLNADGSFGEFAQKAQNFADRLKKKTGAEIILRDERWTTLESKRTAREAGIREKKAKKDFDRICAAIILQEYLDSASQ